MEALDEILAVEGLDGVYVGPADLGLSLFGDPNSEPEDERAIAAIASVRHKAKAAGRMAAEKWDFVTCASDTWILSLGAADNVQQFHGES